MVLTTKTTKNEDNCNYYNKIKDHEGNQNHQKEDNQSDDYNNEDNYNKENKKKATTRAKPNKV